MRTAPPNEAARPRAQAKATLTSERARRARLLGVWDPSTGTVRILPTFPRDIPRPRKLPRRPVRRTGETMKSML
jgi:hypothetical protein